MVVRSDCAPQSRGLVRPRQCRCRAKLEEARVRQFDAQRAETFASRHSTEPMAMPHRVWTLSAVVPGALI
jgi:hypothetical protein